MKRLTFFGGGRACMSVSMLSVFVLNAHAASRGFKFSQLEMSSFSIFVSLASTQSPVQRWYYRSCWNRSRFLCPLRS